MNAGAPRARRAVIRALEHHLPERVVTNAELAEVFTTWTPEKILEKTGIRERHVAAPEETAGDLAFIAATKLLDSTGIDRGSIDLLVLCTQSPDHFLPTTACILQDRLRLPTTAAAFDYNLGCSAYPYGLAIVRGLIESGIASRALLVMAETYSKYIHPLDRSVRTLFGDAASATLITAEERDQPSLGPFVLGTDGSGAANLIVPRGAHRLPGDGSPPRESADESGNVRSDANLFMDGPAILEFTIQRIPKLVAELLRRAELRADEIDHFVLHQANEYMLRYLQRKIGIPDEKFAMHFSHCGNTVSSTIPIVLQSLVESRRLEPGHTVAMIGFGVGYSWGAGLVRWDQGGAA